uniref:Uncharacterized protein n=1 Tax=Anopheles culicifacies TaxID=139723 RepID=A0A182M0B1_9DIPT
MAQGDRKSVRRLPKPGSNALHRTAAVTLSPADQQRNRVPNPIEEGILLMAYNKQGITNASSANAGQQAPAEKKLSYADVLKLKPAPKQPRNSVAGNVQPTKQPETLKRTSYQPRYVRNRYPSKHFRKFAPEPGERAATSTSLNDNSRSITIRELLVTLLGDSADAARSVSDNQRLWPQQDASCTFDYLVSATYDYFTNLHSTTKSSNGFTRNMTRRDFLCMLRAEIEEMRHQKRSTKHSGQQRGPKRMTNEMHVHSASLDYMLSYGGQEHKRRMAYTRRFADPGTPLQQTVLKLGAVLQQMNSIWFGPEQLPVLQEQEEKRYTRSHNPQVQRENQRKPQGLKTRVIPKQQARPLDDTSIRLLSAKLEEMSTILWAEDGDGPMQNVAESSSCTDRQTSLLGDTICQVAMKVQEMKSILSDDGNRPTSANRVKQQHYTQHKPHSPAGLNRDPRGAALKFYDLTMKLQELNSILCVERDGTIRTNSTQQQMPDIVVPSLSGRQEMLSHEQGKAKIYMHLPRVAPNTTEKTIEDMVRKQLGTEDVQAFCLQRGREHQTNFMFVTFKVLIPASLLQKAFDPESWPRGVKRFVMDRKDWEEKYSAKNCEFCQHVLPLVRKPASNLWPHLNCGEENLSRQCLEVLPPPAGQQLY